MDLKPDFSFRPLPEIANPVHLPFPKIPNPLGPLALLQGTWIGKGFNTIWRPHQPGQDRFLELNLTNDMLEFTAISGPIPNRGLLQQDINMFGLTYLQQITDANVHNAGLHIEPGIWASVPATTNPQEPPTVVRMASIPHGTTILAQGVAKEIAGPPSFPVININPFPIGNPAGASPFPEQNLLVPTAFRSPPADIVGITQAMVNNPNSVLKTAIAGQTILHTTVLDVTTTSQPVAGGGTSNTAFLKGAGGGPNADAAQVTSTFWIETVKGSGAAPNFHQLQYSQNVLLNFRGLSWPHVTVATLRQKTPVNIPIQWLDPHIPADLLARILATPPRE